VYKLKELPMDVGILQIKIWLKKEISRCKIGELGLVILGGKRRLVGLFFLGGGRGGIQWLYIGLR